VFITFEGIEGSGKSTQIKLLGENLTQRGHKVKIVREPGGTELGEKIRNIFLSSSEEKIDPFSEVMLLYASRKNLDVNVIRPNLQANNIVIADRYSDATIAYQSYGKGLDAQVIKDIHNFSSISTPNLTFFIDINENLSKQRISGRESLEFFSRVRTGYLEISRNNNRVHIIDGEKSIDQISIDILKIVEGAINASMG
jgi:dTMP kinase